MVNLSGRSLRPGPTRVPGEQAIVPVVLGGDTAAYSVVRSFHEAYGTVGVIVSMHATGPVANSRIVQNETLSQMEDPEVLVPFLINLADRLGDRRLLLLGSADHLVELVVHHRERLEARYTIPYVDDALFDRVSSKESFAQLCAELGVAHPRTVTYDVSGHQSGTTPEAIDYPIMAKPDNAMAYHHVEFEGKKKVHLVESRDELASLLDDLAGAGYRDTFILQEYIPGGDECMRVLMCFSDRSGRTRFGGYAQVLLEEHTPTSLGNAASAVTGSDPAVTLEAARLLDHLGWTGFSTFDLKADPRTGRTYFFEVNPRLGRSNYYLTAGGTNPATLYVEEFLYVDVDADAGESRAAEPIAELQREVLYTLTPPWLVLPYLADRQLRQRVSGLIKRRKVVHPLVYFYERDPRRWAYTAMFLVNQVRKFGRHWPAPARRKR